MGAHLPHYCTNCGASNQQQATICFACGQSLQAQVNATPISSVSTGPLAAGQLLKERYRIVAEISKGRMGTVYKAEDTLLNDHFVAVKVLSQSGLNAQEMVEATTALKSEAHLLVKLNHPHLLKIQDYFADAGRWYFVMDFLQGETLETYVTHKTGGCLPVNEVLDMGIQLCSVLDYLHTHQPPIIFRNLKPTNVMRASDGQLYLIDFGMAHHFHAGLARDTMAVGSVGYNAPEQYGKAQTTPRSDIYSLGAVLYQLLTGTDQSQTLFQFVPLNLHALSLPGGLAALVMQMLEKDENKRPASMAAIKQELQHIAAHVPAKQGINQLNPLIHKTNFHQLSRSSKFTFMALVGLTFLVVSGTWLFSLAQAHQIATTHANVTATANATAATTTAAVDPSWTATVNASTPNALIRTIEVKYLYANTTQVTPTINDPLHDNSKGYGWEEGDSGYGGTCAFKGGAYRVSQSNGNYFQYCTADLSFSNFVFEVHMKIIKGDGGGITFRADTNNNDFYTFYIGQNGSVQLILYADSQSVKILQDFISSAINQGPDQTNLIAVVALGNVMGLFVNHQLVDSVNDNTYRSGQIGVIAMPFYDPTEVVYSNAKVWTL